MKLEPEFAEVETVFIRRTDALRVQCAIGLPSDCTAGYRIAYSCRRIALFTQAGTYAAELTLSERVLHTARPTRAPSCELKKVRGRIQKISSPSLDLDKRRRQP